MVRRLSNPQSLLQGLMHVYGFRDLRNTGEKPIFLPLAQLAMSILYELGLDKPPSKDPGLTLLYDMKGIRRPTRLTRTLTMEERRALLGCFLLSSLYKIPIHI